jgi:hypothetical protein
MQIRDRQKEKHRRTGAGGGDWIVGTGGADLKKKRRARQNRVCHAGHREVVFGRIFARRSFSSRSDTDSDRNSSRRFALISQNYYYFGRNAIRIEDMPTEHLSRSFEKKVGYINSFTQNLSKIFSRWLRENYKTGMNGSPCVGHEKDCKCKGCDCEKEP